MTRRNLLIIGLALSVGLNLFLIGGIGYRLSRISEFAPRPLPPNMEWAIRDLSPERQQELKPLVQGSETAGRRSRFAMFRAQRQISSLMAADEFDSQALSDAFSELRRIGMEYQELSHEQTVAILAELSPEERQIAVEFMQRRGPRPGGPPSRRRGDRDRGPGPDFGPNNREPRPDDGPDR